MILGQWIFGGRTLSGETKTRMAFHLLLSLHSSWKLFCQSQKKAIFLDYLTGQIRQIWGIFPRKRKQDWNFAQNIKGNFLLKNLTHRNIARKPALQVNNTGRILLWTPSTLKLQKTILDLPGTIFQKEQVKQRTCKVWHVWMTCTNAWSNTSKKSFRNCQWATIN